MSRLPIADHAPEGYQAIVALDNCARQNLDAVLLDLVKLRASQLNACGYCVDLHSADLESSGVPPRKIFAVSAWRETPFFTTRERAALALTEEMTVLSDGVEERVWQAAAAAFSPSELSHLVLAIATINAWNRIGVSTRMTPPAG